MESLPVRRAIYVPGGLSGTLIGGKVHMGGMAIVMAAAHRPARCHGGWHRLMIPDRCFKDMARRAKFLAHRAVGLTSVSYPTYLGESIF